ncbi:hypothetical protein GQ457_06G014650 [Hibiscus cannabinus]
MLLDQIVKLWNEHLRLSVNRRNRRNQKPEENTTLNFGSLGSLVSTKISFGNTFRIQRKSHNPFTRVREVGARSKGSWAARVLDLMSID